MKKLIKTFYQLNNCFTDLFRNGVYTMNKYIISCEKVLYKNSQTVNKITK